MRVALFIFLLLLPVIAFCGDKKKPKPMPVSRWREIKRMKPDSTVTTFADTMFITFRAKDSFQYHNKNGFIYNGGYTINEDSLLDFGTARYTIVARKPASLVLVNGDGIFHFVRDSSDTVKVIVLDKDEKIQPVTDIDQMIGRWTVYKRQGKETGSGTLDNSLNIRSAFITGASTDGKLGYIFSSTDASKPSWYIKSLGSDQTLDLMGKTHRVMRVIKCQNGEMILEEEGMKYYFKQFK
jgi:hypothetical protein